MSIGDELGAFAVRGETALTVGVFDGVHRGHTHLISQLVGEAASKGLMAGVVTFREHPAAVLSPSFQARYLTSFENRLDLLNETKIDFAVPITFDRALSKLTAEEFVSLLQDRLQMVSLVVGPDFAMGRNREGTIERLSELGDQMGFTSERSSTDCRIRRARPSAARRSELPSAKARSSASPSFWAAGSILWAPSCPARAGEASWDSLRQTSRPHREWPCRATASTRHSPTWKAKD